MMLTALLSFAMISALTHTQVERETPVGMQPLAIDCRLKKAEPVAGEPSKVRTDGPRLALQILVHESPEFGKSKIVETHDPSGILAGKTFVRFDKMPSKPAEYAVWTEANLQSPTNMMLQVDRSDPTMPSAVLAKQPDDPSFRYLGACFLRKSDNIYGDFERMKEVQP